MATLKDLLDEKAKRNTLKQDISQQQKVFNPFEEDVKQKEQDNLNWWQNFILGLEQFNTTVSEGVLGAFEGILDAGTGLISGALDFFGAEDASKAVSDFTAKNLTKELFNSDFGLWAQYLTAGGWMSGLSPNKYMEQIRNENHLPEIVENIGGGLGSAIGFAALASSGGEMASGINEGLGLTGKAAQAVNAVGQYGGIAVSAFGSGTSEALNDGADIGQALTYGVGTGAVETASEVFVGKILGKLGLGLGKVAGVGKGTSQTVKKGSSQLLLNILKNFNEEGIEEVVSDLANPLLKMATYKKGSSYQELFEEQGGIEGLLESYLIGGLSGGLFETVGTVGNINKYGVKGASLQLQLQNVVEYANKAQALYDNGEYYQIKDGKVLTDSNGNSMLTEKGKIAEDNWMNAIETIEKGWNDYLDVLAQAKADGNLDNMRGKDLYEFYESLKNFDTRDSLKRTIEESSANAGVNVVFGNTNNYNPNTNTITLSQEALASPEIAFKEYFSHEITHYANKQYGSVSSLTLALAGEVSEDTYNAYLKKYNGVMRQSITNKGEVYKSFEAYKKQGLSRQDALDNAKMDYIFEEIAADRAKEVLKNFDDFNRLIKNQKPNVLKRMLTELSNLFKGHRRNSAWNKARRILQERINENKNENNKEATKDSRQKYKLESGESIDYKNKTIYNDSSYDFVLDPYLEKQIDDKFIIAKRANAVLLSEKYVYYCTHKKGNITILNAITLDNYDKWLKEFKDGRNNIGREKFDTRASENEFIRGRRNDGNDGSRTLQSEGNIDTEIEGNGERSRTDSGSDNRNDRSNVKDTRYKIDVSTDEFLNATSVEDFNKLLSQAESVGDYQVIKQRVFTKFKETRNKDLFALTTKINDLINTEKSKVNQEVQEEKTVEEQLDNKVIEISQEARNEYDDLNKKIEDVSEKVDAEIKNLNNYNLKKYKVETSIKHYTNAKNILNDFLKTWNDFTSKNKELIENNQEFNDMILQSNDKIDEVSESIAEIEKLFESNKIEYQALTPKNNSSSFYNIKLSDDAQLKKSTFINKMDNNSYAKKTLLSSPMLNDLTLNDIKLYKRICDGEIVAENELLASQILKVAERYNYNQNAMIARDDTLKTISNELRDHFYDVNNKFLEGAKSKSKDRIACIIVGLPSSGKSSAIANKLLKKYNAFELDNDVIKQQLNGFDGGKGANYVQNASSLISDELAMPQLTKDGVNLVIPIVGKTVKSILNKYDLLIKNGYQIELYNVKLPKIKALNRAFSRFIQTGRYVSLENYLNKIDVSAIDDAFDKCKNLKGVRYYEEFSNDVSFGEAAISLRNSTRGMGEGQQKSKGIDGNSQASEQGRGLSASGGDVDTKQGQQSRKSVFGNDVHGNTQLEINPATRVEKITKIIKSNTIRKTKSAYEARLNGYTYYTETSARNTVKFVNELLKTYHEGYNEVSNVDLKLEFTDKGKEINIDKIFNILNSKRIDKTSEIMKVISPAIKIKVDGKWQSLADYSSKEKLGTIQRQIHNEIKDHIDLVIGTEYKATELGKAVAKLNKEYQNRLTRLVSQNQMLRSRLEKLNGKRMELSNIKTELSTQVKENTSLTDELVKANSELGNVKVNRSLRTLLNKSLSYVETKISNENYLSIAKDISIKKVDNAADKLTNLILDSKIDDSSTYRDFFDEESILGLKQANKAILEDYINDRDPSSISKLGNYISKLKVKIKKIDLLDNIDIAGRKIKREQAFVKKNSQMLPENIVNAFLDFGTLKSKDIVNGAHRQSLLSLKNEILKALSEEKIGVSPDPLLIDMIDNITSIGDNSEVSSDEIYTLKKVIDGLKFYYDDLHGDRNIEFGSNDSGQHNLVKKSDVIEQAIEEQKNQGKKKFGKTWNFVNPFVVFGQMGNTANTLYLDLRNGYDKFKSNYIQILKPIDNFVDSNKSYVKSLAKKITIGKITATKGSLLNIYLQSMDSDGYKHLLNGGLVYENNEYTFEAEEKTRNKVDSDGNEVLYKRNTKDHKIGDNVLEKYKESKELDNFIKELEKTFGDNQSQELIKIVQDIYDNKTRNLKVETDLKIKGFTNVKDLSNGEHYVPLSIDQLNRGMKTDTQFFNTSDTQGIRNMSANMDRTSNMGSLTAINILDHLERHVRQMALYNGTGVAIDNFNTILNSRVSGGDSYGKYLRINYGINKKGTYYVDGYINDLLRDVQGMGYGSSSFDAATSTWISSFRSSLASVQLGANPSVALSQPTSLPMAWKYVNPLNMTKGFARYLKEGAFKSVENLNVPDTLRYRIRNNDYLRSQSGGIKGNIKRFSRVFTKFNSIMDGAAAKILWYSCLEQTNNDFEKAEQLYNKTMAETQPNFDPVGRSAIARSNKEIVNFLMMFTSQPQQNFSNVIEILSSKKALKEHGVGILSGLIVSGLLYTAIKEAFKHITNDDEDKDFEDYLAQYLSNAFVSMIPIVGNNIKISFKSDKMIQLNDLEVNVFSQVNDIKDSIEKVFSTKSSDEVDYKNMLQSLGYVFGIPVNNIYRYSMGFLKKTNAELGYELDAKIRGKKYNTKTDINTALKNNNVSKAKTLYNLYSKNISSNVSQKVLNETFRLYSLGYTEVALKTIPSVFKVDGEEILVNSNDFSKNYGRASSSIEKIISNYKYNSLSDSQKEYCISKLNNAYYNIAKKKQLGNDLSTIELLLDNGFDLSKELVHLAKINELETTKFKTKQKLVQEYINKLPMQKNQKYFLYMLAGYSITEEQKELVKSFLKLKGINYRVISKIGL